MTPNLKNRRLEFHTILCEVLGSDNVYFQPPESVKMNYPAIVYSRDTVRRRGANDRAYLLYTGYSVTVIDKDPDSLILDRLLQLPKCRFDRHYVSDNLNHDVFTIYY